MHREAIVIVKEEKVSNTKAAMASSSGSNNAEPGGFYNDTIGDGRDIVPGQALCRWDVNSIVCRNCFHEASKEIFKSCKTTDAMFARLRECCSLAPHSWSSSSPVLFAGPSRSSSSSSSVLVTPTGVLASDALVALSVGVDGHDLCVAGMGDVLARFLLISFAFVDDISAFLSSRIRCMAINCASFSARFLEFSPRSFSSLFSLLWS
ncbi:hypothetical protein DVH24_011674 [Malus domestica]|uniref:Gnk2-homologous domain-containing protein n=1 Tax=Malus domestica TaxID=3750 RepID=A0A498JTY1_MALDO|nr:hypothetical protein DVH24_011674 [Malus domestica]